MYGPYGIGLSKEWGIQQGISPVLYIHQNTKINDITKNIFDILEKEIHCGNHSDAIRTQNSRNGLLSFIKPYEGRLKRKGKIKKVRFYDEREWRYVQKVENALPWAIIEEKYRNVLIANHLNNSLSTRHKLDFKPDDIKYLIVKDESEILPLISKIENIKEHYGPDSVKLLTSRIITIKQIREDYGIDILK